MTTRLLLLMLLSLPAVLWSQVPGFVWTQTEGGPDYTELGMGVDTDAEGNVYVVGEFRNGAEIGGTVYPSEGFTDAFLAKYDPAGNPVWVRPLGSSSPDNWNAVSVSGPNSIYLAGEGKVGFPSRVMHSKDATFMRYKPDGTLVWGYAVDGDIASDALGIVGDANGNCYGVGNMETKSFFPNGDTLVGAGGRDGYIASFDSLGGYRWSAAFGGTGGDGCNDVTIDGAANLYLACVISETAQFGAFSLTSRGSGDAVLARYDTLGNCIWVRQFGGTGPDEMLSVVAAADGSVYFSGFFMDTLHAPGGMTLVSTGFIDVFYGKMDAAGNLQWLKAIGGSNRELVNGMDLDRNENLYLAGYFLGGLRIGADTATSAGVEDLFFCQVDSNGNLMHLETSHHFSTRKANDIAIDPSQNALLTGGFNVLVDFGGDTIGAVSQSEDIFVTKFAYLAPGIDVVEVTGSPYCGSDVFQVRFETSGYFEQGNRFYLELSDASGSFANPDTIGERLAQVGGLLTGTIPNPVAGGSGYRLRISSDLPGVTSADNGQDITLAPSVATPVTITGDTVVCNGLPVVLSIGNGFVSQLWSTGDTSTFIIVSQPGQYWVEAVDSNGCSNSDQQWVTACVSAAPVIPQPELLLYPNPTAGILQIEMENVDPGKWQVCLVDMGGRVVFDAEWVAPGGHCQRELRFPSLADGLYVLQLRHGAQTFSRRVQILQGR